MSDSGDDMPSDIENEAEKAMSCLVPDTSRKIYEKIYNDFEKWRQSKNNIKILEKMLLAHFSEKSRYLKSSTMWSHYSMLKSKIYINHNINIKTYCNLIAFLKRKSEGYCAKKSKILTRPQVENFLKNANDNEFLLMKVSSNNKMIINFFYLLVF